MNLSPAGAARLRLTASMLIFGTIGIFVRHIPLPSSVIALVRGVVGTVFLLLLTRVRKTSLDRSALRRRLPLLCLSGVAIGFNWILLFEAYRYTTVATATLCYYLAPVFVMLLSPLLLKESLTLRKALCILGALCGMVLVSGVLESGFSGSGQTPGILCGLGAAVLYAAAVLMNKKLPDVPAFDKTILQLGVAALALLPYVLVTERSQELAWTPLGIVLLLVVGILHTGVAYALYFSAIPALSAQTAALFSYIDPVSAILLSALFLKEHLTLPGAIGALLVLGSTLLSELPLGKKGRS